MSLNVYVVSAKEAQLENVSIADDEVISLLGKSREEALAVKLEEIFDAVSTSMNDRLLHGGEMMMEVSGSVTLTAEGSAKFLCFNVGGDASTTNTMKVVVKTQIPPAK